MCKNICRRSTELSCNSAETWVLDCEDMFDLPMCLSELRQFLECTSGERVTSSEYDEQGIAAVKDGHCADPQVGFIACMETASTS